MTPAPSAIDRVAHWLWAARRAVAFSGAGMGTESGIPDFRSPGGVWSRYRPVLYDDFLASAQSRAEFWEFKCAAHQDFAAAQPHAGHLALAHWELAGRLQGVITQNIDGLHQAAGSRQVLELHGTARHVHCVDCAARFDVEPLLEQYRPARRVPCCTACGGDRLKLAVVMFGEALDAHIWSEAERWSSEADLFLVLGSSLTVYPAASLPALAQARGARLVIVNQQPTELDHLAELVLHTPLAATLTAVDARLKELAGGPARAGDQS